MRRLLALAVPATLLIVPATAPAAVLSIGHQATGDVEIRADALGAAAVRLSVVRAGQTIAGGQPAAETVQIRAVAPQAGDQIVLEQPAGTVAASVPYDELPLFDG